MEHIITTYGGGELFFLIFNGIAALFKQDASGMVFPLIRMGLMVGLTYTLILMFLRSNLAEGIHWIFWVILSTNVLFLPKTSLVIHDPLTKERFRVEHIPFALGAFAGFISHIGKTVTEKVESVVTLPDYMPYHQTGVVFASSLMSQVGQFRITDAVFKGNMERFVNQCVVYDAMIGQKYTLSDLQKSPDIWTLVSGHASPVLGFLYQEDRSPGTIVSCREGAKKLHTLWDSEVKRATARYGTRVQNRLLTEAAFSTGLMGSARLLAGSRHIADSAMDILRQEMMIKAIEEGSNNKLSELGSPSNYGSTKALLQQRSTYAIAGEIAARTLPLFKNVIEALSYALFIFIVVLALLPQGYRILMTYFGILLWTQLWAPLYSVLNLIMTLYGRTETSHLLGDEGGLTLLNSAAILNANADMVTLAAWFAVSIPFISYGILKQGASAFVGLAHHLGSAMQAAASGTASETVSGNISLGNTTLGTQAYQNISAFQHLTSPSYNDSQFKAVSSSGIEQSAFGAGNQALMDHSISRLRVQVMGTENTSFSAQENLHKASSLLQSKSIAASNALESSFQDTMSFMKHIGQTFSQDNSHTQSMSQSDAKSLQDFQNYVQDIRQNSNMTESQAFEAAIGAKLGTPDFMASVSGSAGVSTQGSRQQGIEAAQGVAQQTNYSENLERVLSAATAYAETVHDRKGVELGQNALSSFNKAKSLREEASLAHSLVKNLSKDLSSQQSQSFLINKDLTQDILSFIAEQPINPGPEGPGGGFIGYEGARKILEGGGAEREAYLQHFQEKNPHYAIRTVHAADPLLSSQYATKAQALREDLSSSSHTAVIQAKSIEAGLNPKSLETLSSSAFLPTQDLTSSFEKGDARLQQGRQKISRMHQSFKSDLEASTEKNLTDSVLEKGGDFINPFSPLPHSPSPQKEQGGASQRHTMEPSLENPQKISQGNFSQAKLAQEKLSQEEEGEALRGVNSSQQETLETNDESL